MDKRSYFSRVDATEKDVATLDDLLRRGARVDNEHHEIDGYLNGLIKKPWGYEYRVYTDDFIDIWQLSINPGQSTSLHAHPRKTTYLIDVAGTGVSVSNQGNLMISAGDILRIGRGAFHSTRCSEGDKALILLEVETPRNKFDLIRISDQYDRVEKKYEVEGHDLPVKRVRLSGLPNASFHRASLCGQFSFSVRNGMEIFYRRASIGQFAIKLGVDGVLSDDISILTPENISVAGIDISARYLCVERSVS